jgi:hypothetical protein
MKLTLTSLKKLLQGMADPQSEEIGCEDCWNELDRFAELELAGKDASQALPLVESHLQRCGRCRGEYAAFLEALKNLPE